jgi:asparagine synthase (glutamine-hydrolysing)
MQDRYNEALGEVPHLAGESEVDKRIRELFYLNLTRFGGTLLERKDRMTAAAGVEARVPFCDYRLIEYVWNIPWSLKTIDNRARGLLRRAVAKLLHDTVVDRQKSPYPKTHNPAYLSAVRSRLYEVLENPQSPLLDLIDITEVQQLAASAGALHLPFYGQLMTGPQLLGYLLQVNTWLEEYGVSVKV